MKLPYVELLLIGKTSREIKSIDVKYCQILISHYRHCRTSSFLFLFEEQIFRIEGGFLPLNRLKTGFYLPNYIKKTYSGRCKKGNK